MAGWEGLRSNLSPSAPAAGACGAPGVVWVSKAAIFLRGAGVIPGVPFHAHVSEG
jgi:hypothetical protein